MSTRIPNTPFLRLALLADAAASGSMAILLIFAAGPLAGPLGLPAPFLLPVGALLLPWAAGVAWLGCRPAPRRAAVLTVVAGNAIWVACSAIFLLSGAMSPTGLGVAFVVAQAIAVTVLAELQFIAQRNAGRSETLAA